MFRDRTGAGCVLAELVAERVFGPVLVAGIPGGGLPVAGPVALRLGAPLAVAYARKLSAASVPGVAFGGLDEDGQAILDELTVRGLRLGPEEVQYSQARAARELRRQMALCGEPPLARRLPFPVVVLVDDGLCTGLTMAAAVACARRHGAGRIVVATPCASVAALERLCPQVDAVISPVVDEGFAEVAQYYLDFSPVTDSQMQSLLSRRPSPIHETTTVGGGSGGSP